MHDVYSINGSCLPAIAHSLPGKPESDWEPLSTHSAAVAKLASDFASAFGAAEWGRWLGRWHDLGKASDEFQEYIRQSNDPDAGEQEGLKKRIDHSTFGARHAVKTVPNVFGQLMAFCIAGHHAGLADATTGDDAHQRSTLSYRLDPARYEIPEVTLPAETVAPPKLRLPFTTIEKTDMGFALSFFTRMLFSALIDADRLATEGFCDPAQAAERQRHKPSLADLRDRLDQFLQDKQRQAPPTPVNQIRAGVLRDCLAAASLPPGFFSLNVPTGGGKTLASLAFALHHANHHPSLRRVLVGIPFTSIIEQTAEVYRDALGSPARHGLIEHHSSLNPQTDTRRNKLAAENWDAPLVVTTNVQLYESLFAAKTSPARKLHRLAHSVIILDEAQTMPIDLLTATLAALKELVTRYGCSVVLCTATQPALEHRAADFIIGLKNVRPIIANAPALHAQLKRVAVEHIGQQSDDQLVARLADERRVLCVVNTKAHAAAIYDGLVAAAGKSGGCYHLSTFMCAQHRRDVLANIRERLTEGQSCRVVSTQLIEAGVDVDFPCVYRAAAGFDSIAQSAGRCNREGALKDAAGLPTPGRVYVFDGSRPPPPGLLRQAADTARELAGLHPDPLAPSAVEAYFKLLYWSRQHEWDKHRVMPCFEFSQADPAHAKLIPLKFRTAAEAYQLIRDEQTPILVPYDAKAKVLIKYARTGAEVDYSFVRETQPYTVSVRDHLLRKMVGNHALYEHPAGFWVLDNESAYSREKGLSPEAVGFGPEALVQ